MYGISMTVAACLKAGTRADVAWLVSAGDLAVEDWSDAVVYTPGGGKIGSLLAGALDGALAEYVGRLKRGRLVEVEVSPADALVFGLPEAGSARVLVVPADTLPSETWDIGNDHRRLVLVVDLDGDEIEAASVYDADTISEAADEVREVFESRTPGSTFVGSRVISVFDAVPRLVIVGGGPIAEALAQLAPLVGWQPMSTSDRDTAIGLIAPLSGHDKVVIAAHDLELAGAGLAAALDSRSGYIGSVGSRKMQADRADWLAYRGITDLDRVNGPAGLDIGADGPGEVAVAIVAEAIANYNVGSQ
jgi:xanthine dehydrogenase accessory factor